jgi:electron transport complex protein RnfC
MIFNNNRSSDFKEKGGFKIDISMKTEALDDPFTEIPPAETMVVFLRQHVGSETRPIVKEGDSVSYGQKLGDYDSKDSLAVPIHSPVNGRVLEIKKMIHPLSRDEETAILLETAEEKMESPMPSLNPKEVSREELIKRVRETGIVGLGGAAFPTHVKLAQENISHLIINAKESDPNVACDFRLMKEKAKGIIDGIKLMGKILDVNNLIYATRTQEGETPELDQLLRKNNIEIVRIRPNYSIGSEELLVMEILGIEIPAGKYPPSKGVVVQNVSTAYAVANAIKDGEPLVSRGLTLYSKKTGAKNLWVRMGTPVEHILNQVGVSPKDFVRIVLGSVFMGQTIPNPSYPVLKATSGITAFTKEERDPYANPLQCIRCGYCNTVCPVYIYPQLIMEAEKKGDVDRLKKLHVEACIDCGLCSYVCPSRIKFTKYLTGGKRRIHKEGNIHIDH